MPTTFPASVDVFTVKRDDVDLVRAADVNNLQDAVAALEGYLIPGGGTAVVHIAGTETITGPKTFSASPTFSAGATINGSVATFNAAITANSSIVVAGVLAAYGNIELRDPSTLIFKAPVGKIIPGATSLAFRNNADTADNLLVSDAGVVSLRNTLLMSAGSAVQLQNTGVTANWLVGPVNASKQLSISSAQGKELLLTNPLLVVVGAGFAGTDAQIYFRDDSSSPFSIWERQSSAAQPQITFRRARAAGADLQSGDPIGRFDFWGRNQAGFLYPQAAGASIDAVVDGTPQATYLPTRFVFTTSGSDGTFVERLRINQAGATLTGDIQHSTADIRLYFRSDNLLLLQTKDLSSWRDMAMGKLMAYGPSNFYSTLSVSGNINAGSNIGFGAQTDVIQPYGYGFMIVGAGSVIAKFSRGTNAISLTPDTGDYLRNYEGTVFYVKANPGGPYGVVDNSTTQRFALFDNQTFSAGDAGTYTITTAATLAIKGAPIAGTRVTITNPYALWVQGGLTRLDGGLTETIAGQAITPFQVISNDPTYPANVSFGPHVGAGSSIFNVYDNANARLILSTERSNGVMSFWQGLNVQAGAIALNPSSSAGQFYGTIYIANDTTSFGAWRLYKGGVTDWQIRITPGVGVGDLAFNANGSDSMVLDSAGDLHLNVANRGIIANTGFYLVTQVSSTLMQVGSGGGWSGGIRFSPGSSNHMTLSSAGMLTVTAGITTQTGIFDVTLSPGGTAYVRSTATDTGIQLTNTTAAGRNWILGSGGTGSGFPGTFYLYDSTRPGVVLQADSTGLVTIANNLTVAGGLITIPGSGAIYAGGAGGLDLRANGSTGTISFGYGQANAGDAVFYGGGTSDIVRIRGGGQQVLTVNAIGSGYLGTIFQLVGAGTETHRFAMIGGTGGAGAEQIASYFGQQIFKVTATFTPQRFHVIAAPVITASSPQTVNTAATFAITGAPSASGSAAITNPLAMWIQAGYSRFDGWASFAGLNSTSINPNLGGLDLRTTDAAGLDVGPAIAFLGESGNGVTPYKFAIIRGTKNSVVAGDYSGRLEFKVVGTTGGGVVALQLSATGSGTADAYFPTGGVRVSGNLTLDGGGWTFLIKPDGANGEIAIRNNVDNGYLNFKAGSIAATANLSVGSALTVTGGLGFYGTSAQGKQGVTGSKGGNAALASLIAAMVAYGLITDSTT